MDKFLIDNWCKNAKCQTNLILASNVVQGRMYQRTVQIVFKFRFDSILLFCLPYQTFIYNCNVNRINCCKFFTKFEIFRFATVNYREIANFGIFSMFSHFDFLISIEPFFKNKFTWKNFCQLIFFRSAFISEKKYGINC